MTASDTCACCIQYITDIRFDSVGARAKTSPQCGRIHSLEAVHVCVSESCSSQT